VAGPVSPQADALATAFDQGNGGTAAAGSANTVTPAEHTAWPLADSGISPGCACPACAASRAGDTFKAEPTGDANVDIGPAAIGFVTNGGAAMPTAPSYATSALLSGSKWGGSTVGNPVTVTYSFLTSLPGYYSGQDEASNFTPMNAAQRQAARDSFAMFAAVANISFVEVASAAGSINLGTADLGNGIGGWAYYPGSTSSNSFAGDVWITNGYPGYNNPTPGSWQYNTYIHEVGHAIGLKHPGNYNAGGGGTGGPYLPSTEDNHQYTVMSYYSGPNYGVIEPITPQLYDIAAVQYLYGVNNSTRTGNDTYTFSTSTQIRTIWDAGGIDTFDASNQTTSTTINLNAASFSSIAGINNIAIAYGVTIEQAIGGSGADNLWGSAEANNLVGGGADDGLWGADLDDVLTGGVGRDYIDGGAGSDTAVFSDASSSYSWTKNADGSVSITDLRGGSPDGSDYLINVEYLQFTNGTVGISNLVTTGTAGVDSLWGGGGVDIMDAQAGDDGLWGAGGNDILTGGAGRDYLDGGAGDDTAAFSGAAWNYSSIRNADGSISITDLRGGSPDGSDYLINIEFLQFTDGTVGASSLATMGTSGADSLWGGSGADTLNAQAGDDGLWGGGGNDILTGGAGRDYIDGGAGDDTAVFSGASSSYSSIRSVDGSVSITDLRGGSPDGSDYLINIEFLQFTDGTIGISSLATIGTSGVDHLQGGSGADTLDALAGDDGLWGGGGDDTLTGGAGRDYIDGGAGFDTAVYTGSMASYDRIANANGSWSVQDLRPGSPDGTDYLTGVERLSFTDGWVVL
jgi:Ca2+-binding RTX toxin-like protein